MDEIEYMVCVPDTPYNASCTQQSLIKREEIR